MSLSAQTVPGGAKPLQAIPHSAVPVGWGVGPLLVGLTLGLIALGLVLPGFPMGHCAQDFAAVLDGAYRILQGQVPHVDFSLPTGSLILFQGVLALKVAPWMPEFYALQLSLWLLLLPVVWPLAQRQQGTLARMLVIGAASLLALVPYVVVYEPIPEFNYNAIYNRAASAVLFLTLVWAVSPKRRGTGDVLILSWLILLGLGWKVSHVVVMLGVLVALAFASSIARAVLLRALLVVAGGLVLLDLTGGGMVRGYGRDILGMLQLNRGGAFGQMLFLAMRCLMVLPPLALLVWLLVPQGTLSASVLMKPRVVLRRWRPALLVGLSFAALLVSESQGTGNVALFGLLVLPVLVARLASPQRQRAGTVAILVAVLASYPMLEGVLRRGTTLMVRQGPSYRAEPALAPVLGRVVVSARNDEVSRSFSALWQAPAREDYRRFERDYFAGITPVEAGQGLSWARGVVEMVEVARRSGLVDARTRVTSIGFTEPFARALGAQSARGTKLWLDPGRTVGVMSEEDARRYLTDAQIAFVQLCPARDSLADLQARPFPLVLSREFTRLASTPCYEMWARKGR